jgi:hypothetical protein
MAGRDVSSAARENEPEKRGPIGKPGRDEPGRVGVGVHAGIEDIPGGYEAERLLTLDVRDCRAPADELRSARVDDVAAGSTSDPWRPKTSPGLRGALTDQQPSWAGRAARLAPRESKPLRG